nr:MAG TPA: integrase [Caudoviricetes sp.]
MNAIYARQSVDKKDSISIETQIEYAKRELMDQPYKVYTDKGYSGKNTNRPAFEEMMREVEAGNIEKVAVYRLDRISRSIVDFADFISRLEEHNASFLSATERFDTSTPVGRAMLYIVVVFAQLERETIAERVRDNYYDRIKHGAWGGGPAAYGFDLVKTTVNGKKATVYQPNAQLEVVKRIFQYYTEPFTSLADIQKRLLAEGVKSARGANFDNSKLSSILKNPAYVRADQKIYNYYQTKGAVMVNPPEDFDGKHGCMLAGKRESNERKYTNVSNHVLAIGKHEGVIDSDVFLFCQEKLAGNQQIKNAFKGKHSWLTGLVKCGYCGYSFSVRFSTTKDGRVPYFACSGRYVHKACDVVQTHRVYDVEAIVEKRLLEHAAAMDVIDGNQENPQAKLNLDAINDLDKKIENLVSTLETAGQVSMEYINRRIEQLHMEKQAIMDNYTRSLLAQRQERFDFDPAKWDSMNVDDKRNVARHMIQKVVLTKDGVNVVWKG